MKALEIQIATVGPQHPDTAASYRKLGSAYNGKGEYDRAIEHHLRALEIYLATLGPQAPETATSYDHLGNAHNKKGEYHKAITYYLKALEIQLLTCELQRSGMNDETVELFKKVVDVWLTPWGSAAPIGISKFDWIIGKCLKDCPLGHEAPCQACIIFRLTVTLCHGGKVLLADFVSFLEAHYPQVKIDDNRHFVGRYPLKVLGNDPDARLFLPCFESIASLTTTQYLQQVSALRTINDQFMWELLRVIFPASAASSIHVRGHPVATIPAPKQNTILAIQQLSSRNQDRLKFLIEQLSVRARCASFARLVPLTLPRTLQNLSREMIANEGLVKSLPQQVSSSLLRFISDAFLKEQQIIKVFSCCEPFLTGFRAPFRC